MMLQRAFQEMLLGARALQQRDARLAKLYVISAETEDGLFYRVHYDSRTADWGGAEEEEYQYGSFTPETVPWHPERSVDRIKPSERTLTLRFEEPYDLASGERVLLRKRDLHRGRVEALRAICEQTAQPSDPILQLLSGKSPPASGSLSVVQAASPLTPRQAKAIAEAEAPLSWIWGPPGTGKTHVLGTLAALEAKAGKRVMLITLANAAADVLALAADDGFDREGATRTKGDILRLGMVVSDELTSPSRKHLLRFNDELEELNRQIDFLRREIDHLEYQTEGSLLTDIRVQRRLHECREQLAGLQGQRRQILNRLLSEARCVVTNTWQVLNTAEIGSWAPDLLCIDEASMICIAEATALSSMPHGRLVVCGDPMQLPPVLKDGFDVRVDGKRVSGRDLHHWFAQSLFDLRDLNRLLQLGRTEGVKSSVTLLDVQRRMAEPIADAVSKLFYGGELKTRPNLERKLPPIRGWPDSHLVLISPKHGPLPPGVSIPARLERNECARSAAIAAELARTLRTQAPGFSCLLLSPYRATAERLSVLTPDIRSKDCSALTVHRAQGSEADVVFFCLVNSRRFVRSGLSASRIKCVALSRARCQLFVIATTEDLAATGLLNALELEGQGQWWQPNWSLLLRTT